MKFSDKKDNADALPEIMKELLKQQHSQHENVAAAQMENNL